MATYTPNYGLHQWAPEDNFLRTDFNTDFLKIDTALKNMSKIVLGSYVGTGEIHTAYTSIDMGFAPQFVLIMDPVGYRFIRAFRGTSRTNIATSSNSYYYCDLEWTQTGLQWINNSYSNEAADQLNDAGTTYSWLAVG